MKAEKEYEKGYNAGYKKGHEDGYEEASVCSENAEFMYEKTDPDANIHKHYKCTVCGREWQEIYLYDGKYDMDGERL